MDKKVDVYVVMKNEEDILPFTIQYWLRFANSVTVLDNGSTDKSLEILSKCPICNIRYFNTGGKLDDGMNQYIKNTVWKQSRGKADWVFVGDTDECLYVRDYSIFDSDASILELPWYDLVNDSKPRHRKDKLLHQVTDKWAKHPSFGKHLLFNPNKVEEINYSPGAHSINPQPEPIIEKVDADKAMILHINKGFGIDYKLDKMRQMRQNFSDNNLQHGWGYHYFDENSIINDYRNKQLQSVDLSDL